MLNQDMMTSLTTAAATGTMTTAKNWGEFDICLFFSVTRGTWGAYMAIFLCLVGLVSNLVLLYTVTKSVVLRGAPSNLFIASVAMGNLLLLLLTAPAYIKHEFELCWRLGISACKFYAFAEVVSISGIAFSMVGVTYERYRAAKGMKEMDTRMKYMVLACIWLGALIFATPTVFLADLAFDNFCYVRPHFEPQGKAYVVCQFLCVYLVPSVYNITVRLWAWAVGDRDEQDSEVPHHTPKQLNNATAVMSASLVIAWIPFYIFAIGLEFQTLPFDDWTIIANLYDAQYIVLYFNSALAPFILWAFSGVHRASLMEDALCGARCCGGVACCRGGQAGDRYSTFRNEFDLDGAGPDLPRVEYSPEYSTEYTDDQDQADHDDAQPNNVKLNL